MAAGPLGVRTAALCRTVLRVNRAHLWFADGVLAAAMLVIALIWAKQYREVGDYAFDPRLARHFHRLDGLSILLITVMSFATAVRRRAPATTIAVTCVAVVVYSATGYPPTSAPWSALLGFYTLACVSRRRRVLPFAVVIVAAWWYYATTTEGLGRLLVAAQAVVFVVITWIFGDMRRRLNERNVRLAALTAELRREQAARAERAVASERVRIARELHDVVAHHMSVVSVQVGLAQYVLASDPESARGAMANVESETHEALQDMRRLLAVLRVGGDENEASASPFEPAPGLARLDELVERMRTSGLVVEATVVGEPVPLPPGPDLCAFRVAQESLTNVLKHAAGAKTSVELVYQEHDLILRVADDGGRASPLAAAAGSGHGVAGMRERARIYGGTLVAGPRREGGFEVVLTLPLGAR